MKASFLFALVCILSAAVMGAPPSADQVLSEAKSKAAAENKAIFVHFGASWCGWCKRLDALLERPEIKPAFEKNFIPVKLDVQEQGKNKALENAGAEKLFKRLGGFEAAGLPFFAFLDRDAKLIVNSMRPVGKERKENIAYPGEPERASWFIAMMKKAAPAMSDEDLNAIEKVLKPQKN